MRTVNEHGTIIETHEPDPPKKDKVWNEAAQMWEEPVKLFWKFVIWKYSLWNKRPRYRLFRIKGPKLHRSHGSYIEHDADELLEKYGSKWQIPTNKNWKFFRNGKEIQFKDI